MIEEAQDFIPIWMLLSAAFGFLVGETCGDHSRHRKCLEQSNADLRDRLQDAPPSHPTCRGHSISNGASSTTSTSASSL